MTAPVIEGLERLASLLALLTSEDGEAENAARAAGQLGRRLGLSGGQLKAIFLAGVRTAGVPVPPSDTPVDPETLARTEQEANELRRLLDRTDEELRRANQIAQALRAQNEELREAVDRARTGGFVWRVATAVVLCACIAGAAAVWWLAPAPSRAVAGQIGTGSQRTALAGAAGVTLFRDPDTGAEQVGRLAPGTPLPVRELLWRGLTQWVRTDAGGHAAYASATQVDLR